MRRHLQIAITLNLAATAALALQSCKGDPEVAAPAQSGRSGDIITLADGATMVAAKGSRPRAMAEWIATAGPRGGSLDLASDTFTGETAVLSRTGLGDAATLASLLDATADARIVLIVRKDPQDVAAGDLSSKRADALVTFLEGRGIASDRLAVRADRSKQGANEASLTLVAERGSWRDPIKAAVRS
ncbi:hypothetical protein ASE06_12780 [Sphingopyxis sp. Root214]|uniref:hypothetical protein n=1 Tax=unclassified Sphingopyxis TaxID=2614943 RepID=UPI0006FDBCFD|nr:MULTISPECIES: hypothetical protein [unclassified Sphingopyxis]KQZ73270.1 hypothetical protein ASD73_10430 [Sphingopyxis sp. Root154]KRC07417.1 hypothetical protein ASE06_12780 [Sphingopyxis sp. Root214]